MSGQLRTNSDSKEHDSTACSTPLPSKQQNSAQRSQDAFDTCNTPDEDNSCSCDNSRPVTSKMASSGACVKLAAGCKTVTAGSNLSAAAAAASAAFVATKLGLCDQLESALAKTPALASLKDAEGRCCLHYAAGYGHEECVDLLLDKGGPELMRLRDQRGDLPLHMAAQQGHPMCTYNLAKACTASCMAKNKAGHSPIEVAAAAGRGEVLNAMLLACSGDGNSTVAVAAIRLLLAAGAVPDTWAPNGSSALMLAAAANSVAAVQVLLDGGATVELQDALGRSALMFAAGSDATAACDVLLGAHASLSARDRRGRAALDYATAGSTSAKLLQKRLDELECVASQLQQQLLQEGGLTACTTAKQARGKTAAAVVGVAGGLSASGAAEASSSKKKKKKKTGSKATATSGSTDCHAVRHAEFTSTAPPAAATPPPAAALVAADDSDQSTGTEVAGKDLAVTDAEAGCVQKAPQDTCSTAESESCTVLDGGDSKLGTQATGVSPVFSDTTPLPGEPAQVAAVADVPVADAELQSVEDSQGDRWQVVVPKGKHRAAPPVKAAGPELQGSHAGVSGKPSAAKVTRCQSHPQPGGSGTNALHQQALVAAASLAAGQDHTHPGRHHAQLTSAEAAAMRHKRQGSAHSICSTVSFASCDSSSCSALSCNSTHATGCSSTLQTASSACHHNKGLHGAGQPGEGQQEKQAMSSISSARMANRSAAGSLPLEQPHQQTDVGASGFKAALLKGGQESELRVAHAATKVETAAMLPGSVRASSVLQEHMQGAEAQKNISSVQDREATSESEPEDCRSTAVCSTQDVGCPLSVNAGADLFETRQGGHAAGAAGSAARAETEAEAEPEVLSSVSDETADKNQQEQQQHVQEAIHPAVAAGSSGSSEHHEQMAGELLQARADLAAAQLQLRQQVAGHQQQLATILENAAAHEATAVQAAVEGAVLETLRSPLLLQVLSAGVQQAVIRERATMQARLLQLGVPPGAVLHILSQPAAAAAGRNLTEPVSGPHAEAGAQGSLSCADDDTGTSAGGTQSSVPATTASSVPAVPECTSLMTHMLSAVAHNVLAASAASAASGSSTPTAQQLQLQQMLSFQRLCQQHHQQEQHVQQQRQGSHRTATTPQLHLDLRSEFCGGSSAFVSRPKQQADKNSQQRGSGVCSGVADASLTLQRGDQAEGTSATDAKGASLLDTVHRRSSSGCSTMSTVDDVLVPHGVGAPRSSYGTIGCCSSAAIAHNSSSPHSSSCCSSVFGPAGHSGSPLGGGMWGDVSVAGSPALGTPPLLGPAFTHGLQSGQHGATQRPSLLGCPAGVAFASERAATAAAMQGVLMTHSGVPSGCGPAAPRPGAFDQGCTSLESTRLVDLLPDEL